MLKSVPARRGLRAILIAGLIGYAGTVGLTGSADLQHAATAQQSGKVPGESLGNASDTDLWRAIRKGERGSVSIPDQQARVLIQSEGDNWRAIRNGPLSVWGWWLLFMTIALLAAFFVLRGRIRIEAGWSERVVERFNGLERFAHWLTAGTFVILGLTGLNLLYGRYILKPLLGPEIFATITLWGKVAHNYLAFAFMLGLVMIFVLWVKDNFPNRHDLVWIARLGGLFSNHSHPPAKKFNAGQKLIFWAVILGGLSLSLSGLMLLFPFEFAIFAGTNAVFNMVGFSLPTELTPMQEMQLAQVWHAVVGLVLIAIMLAHIYIGTVGMEGAFDAMGTGMVDENWAREHHSEWVAELEKQAAPGDD